MSTNIDDCMQKKKAIDAYNTIRDLCKGMNNDCASCVFYGLQPYCKDKECEFTRVVVPEGWEPINNINIKDSDSEEKDSEEKDSEKIADDNVNHPSHYTSGKIEVIDFIEDKGLGFHLGNAIKYISRAGKKDPNKTIEDLRKAIWYINRQISLLENEENE